MARFTFNQTSNTAAQEGGREKAAAFINLYLPLQNGGKAKIGAIALRKGNADEAKLLEWLKGTQPIVAKDQDNNEVSMLPTEYLQQMMLAEFNEVRTEAHKFALPGM